jgi:dipeptidyl aminopeptidase/acylaminoacyl peptidase
MFAGRMTATLLALAAAALCTCAAAGEKEAAKGAAGTERIVFSSNSSGAWRIWSMKADGSDRKQLTEARASESDVDPTFSPDCKTILFTSTRDGKIGAWKMAPDGSDPERICDGDQAEWSPDGKKIVFRRNEAIYTRDLGTGEEKKLTPGDWPHCSAPSWSPDGKLIAFAARWDKGNGLFLASPEGGVPKKVYDKQGACEPHWSADGKTIVYETTTHICTIKPDGSDNQLVTYFGGVQRYGRYSPDGAEIIFCQGASEKGPLQIYTVPAEGGSPTKLTDGSSDMYPDWRRIPGVAR